MRLLFLLSLLAGPLSAGEYALRPGDKLRIEVMQDSDLNRSVLVLPDGTFAFPMVGSVAAAGRSVNAVQAVLRQGLSPNYANPPDVYLSVTSLAKQTKVARNQGAPRATTTAPQAVKNIAVFAMGELKRPGRMEIVPGTTLLQFIAQVGGLTPFAAEKRVKVQRRDPSTGRVQVVTVNIRKIMRGAQAPINALAEGDVIIVPERRLFE